MRPRNTPSLRIDPGQPAYRSAEVLATRRRNEVIDVASGARSLADRKVCANAASRPPRGGAHDLERPTGFIDHRLDLPDLTRLQVAQFGLSPAQEAP